MDNSDRRFMVVTILVIVLITAFILLVTQLFNSPNQEQSNSDLVSSNQFNQEDSVPQTNTVEDSNDESQSAVFTRQQVAQANTYENCMVIYSGGVYAVPSEFIDEHEGGASEILDYCGRDLTDAFDENIDHTNESYDQLREFYVGELAN